MSEPATRTGRTATANTASARRRLRARYGALLLVLASLAAGIGAWVWWSGRSVEPVRITVGTGPFGSDAHILMGEVAEVVARHSDTLRVTVRPTADASHNIALLNAGRIDAGVIRADTPVVNDIRVIAGLYPDLMQVITRDGSGAFRITDLADGRVSVPPYGTDGFQTFWALGDHYDLPISAMDWRAEPFTVGAQKLLSGEIDTIFTMRSLRDAQLVRMFQDAELKSIKLRFIPVRQARAISVKRPFLSPTVIPAGTFSGATPVPTIDVITSSVERILVSRVDVPDEAIRELTRILFEHRLDLTIRFSLASAISQPDSSQGLSVPLHEGAIAYYQRDEPSFIQENAEPLALLVTVMTVMVSGLFAIRSRFVSRQKNRADTYNYQLLDLQKRAASETDLKALEAMKADLNRILETVVVALDTDEVTDEGFQSFSLLWGAVRETINDRMTQCRQSVS